MLKRFWGLEPLGVKSNLIQDSIFKKKKRVLGAYY